MKELVANFLTLEERRISYMKRHFLNISDMDAKQLKELLDVALDIKINKSKYASALLNRKIGLYFQKPSMRTRVSFEVGVVELGGSAINLQAEEIKIGSREPIKDVARVLSRYLDMMMLRVNRHTDLEELSNFSTIPIINGLSDLSHPCQALADILTVIEKRGKNKTKITYFGDGNNVCNSLIEITSLLDFEMIVCCPEGYEPSLSSSKYNYKIIRDPIKASKSSNVIYTDVWTSMGQEKEEFLRKKIFSPFKVTTEILKNSSKDAIFMHCLPAHRGEEVDEDVFESVNSVVFQQAENRLHAQKALMIFLLH
jgi:ornithine carbamoyltransferase